MSNYLISRFDLHLQGLTMTFVINLAFCDFLYCSLHLPIYAVQNIYEKPMLQQEMCAITAIFRNIVMYADYMSIGMIALSRLIKITKKCLFLETYKRILCLCVWIYACLLLIPQLMSVNIGINFKKRIREIEFYEILYKYYVVLIHNIIPK